MLSIIQQAKSFGNKTAILSDGKAFTYEALLEGSKQFAGVLLSGADDLKEARVAFMVNPGFDYVKVQWAVWQAGGIAVPLCLTHPLPSLEYVLEDTGATVLVLSPQYEAFMQPLIAACNVRVLVLGQEGQAGDSVTLPVIDKGRRAMILYTSGTTNKPKGVVTTHHNLEAQISTLVSCWKWTKSDHTLCVLPLHHVHGIINVVSCSLWSGAICQFIEEFSPEKIFGLFSEGKINVFMAVPTIYYKLITYWESLLPEKQQALTLRMMTFRLMVCGSAALPVSVMDKWRHISGHTLLERYGMTEIGMAVSNPYEGERKAGYIGMPLPGVSVKLVNENYAEVPAGEPGEIIVKGANVFKEYWNKPEATAKEFTADGWFKTGDVAVKEDGYYRILGRNSVDIIKSGGYKISALEIEEELRKHDLIADCAVVGIPSDEWGELIVSAIVPKDKIEDVQAINTWLRERMASYKTPRKYLVVDALPRNAMGKVTKNDVKKLFES
jgi:malonyl-CoA/methylmalonyl-CoA synthetase